MPKPHHRLISLLFSTSLAVIISRTSAVAVDTTPPLPLSSSSSTNNHNTNNNNNKPPLQLPTLPFPPPNTSNFSNQTLPPHIPPPPPPSSLPPTTTTTNPLSYVCNGQAFGHDLLPSSCNDAIRRIGISGSPLSFGMRDDVEKDFDIRLPQRFISSDGKCVVEPNLAAGVEEGRGSWEDVAVAALVLVDKCVEEELSMGGVAKNIGSDNNLLVILSKYDPTNIRCYGTMRAPNVQAACLDILDDMLASDRRITFGPKGADVRVPYLLLSYDLNCKFTIRTTAQKGGGSFTDTYSWGRFWEAGVALAGVCVREGKEGVMGGIGERGHLYMEVGGPQG